MAVRLDLRRALGTDVECPPARPTTERPAPSPNARPSAQLGQACTRVCFGFNRFPPFSGRCKPRVRLGGEKAQSEKTRLKYLILQSQKMKLNDWFNMFLSGGVRGRYYQRPAALIQVQTLLNCTTGRGNRCCVARLDGAFSITRNASPYVKTAFFFKIDPPIPD